MKIPCGDDHWVPYDANISPVENLYDKPDNLDPQPEFPLRTKMVFYKETNWDLPKIEILEGDLFQTQQADTTTDTTPQNIPTTTTDEPVVFPWAPLLLVVWIMGLVWWCSVFLRPSVRRPKGTKTKKKLAKDV